MDDLGEAVWETSAMLLHLQYKIYEWCEMSKFLAVNKKVVTVKATTP
jgi:hypothetical protein